VKNKRITSAIAALALVIVGSFAVPAMATDEDTGGQCVPSDARTETIEHPAVTHTETRTVIEEEAWTETVTTEAAHWLRYSYNGRWDSNTEAPAFPGYEWQPNVEGDPHRIDVAGAYWRSDGNSGNGDWFYLEWIEAVTRTVEHSAITHEETVTITDKEAWTETIAHPAIVCPSAEVVVEEDVIVPEVVVEEDVIVPEVVVEEDVIVPEVVVVVAPAAVVVAPAAVAIAAAPRFAG